MNENRIALAEIATKRIVIYSLCGIAWMLSGTVAYLSVRAVSIPDPLDRLVTFVLGNICGVLATTGLNRAFKQEPVPVVNASEEPLKVEQIGAD